MTDGGMSEISPLDRARQLLATMTSPARTAAVAKEVLALLDQVEQQHARPSEVSRPSRRGAVPVIYTVQTTEIGENLAEHRPDGSSRPFRCPRPVYDAFVEVLAEAKRPVSTDEIVQGVEKLIGYRPGDHQYRVPLRLFLHVSPPLLVRSRARYSLPEPKTFATSAAKLWASLKA